MPTILLPSAFPIQSQYTKCNINGSQSNIFSKIFQRKIFFIFQGEMVCLLMTILKVDLQCRKKQWWKLHPYNIIQFIATYVSSAGPWGLLRPDIIYYALVKYNILKVEACVKNTFSSAFTIQFQYTKCNINGSQSNKLIIIFMLKNYNYRMCENFFNIMDNNKNLLGILWMWCQDVNKYCNLKFISGHVSCYPNNSKLNPYYLNLCVGWFPC